MYSWHGAALDSSRGGLGVIKSTEAGSSLETMAWG